jgi:hypothetical protein
VSLTLLSSMTSKSSPRSDGITSTGGWGGVNPRLNILGAATTAPARSSTGSRRIWTGRKRFVIPEFYATRQDSPPDTRPLAALTIRSEVMPPQRISAATVAVRSTLPVHGPVAPTVEQRTFNPKRVGSSPTGPTATSQTGTSKIRFLGSWGTLHVPLQLRETMSHRSPPESRRLNTPRQDLQRTRRAVL